jgi:hypothetical protein
MKHYSFDPIVGMDFNSTLSDDVSVMVSQLTLDRERIFKERLKELGIELDLEKERTRRFKSFFVERSSQIETPVSENVYYNDGSDDGLLVITFFYLWKRKDIENGISIVQEMCYV